GRLRHALQNGDPGDRKDLAQAFVHELVVEAPDSLRRISSTPSMSPSRRSRSAEGKDSGPPTTSCSTGSTSSRCAAPAVLRTYSSGGGKHDDDGSSPWSAGTGARPEQQLRAARPSGSGRNAHDGMYVHVGEVRGRGT